MKPRGFAWMKIHDPERLREIARRGGKKSQKSGKGARWSQKEAREQAEAGARARWKWKGVA